MAEPEPGIRVERYRPAFFSGFDEEHTTVQNLPELLTIPWVASWTKNPKFFRFSVADGTHLMAELDHNKEWWVVAFFPDKNPPTGLPEWVYPR